MIAIVLASVLLLSMAVPVSAQQWSSARPDGHAPLGVMGDHTHERGEVMVSYRFMPMRMAGNRDGADPLTVDTVLARFPVTPLQMQMNMHMIGVMVAPSARVTLMGMLPILDSTMDHQTRAGGQFATSAAGIGDVRLTALLRLFNHSHYEMHANLGVSVPTGAIDRTDVTPASAPSAAILPYPMQTGSGTWDLMSGATVLGQSDRWSWGAQGLATIRLGESDRGYRLGHRGLGTGWIAHRVNDWISASARLEGSAWGDVHGADPALNPTMVPTARPDLRAGKRLDIGVGLNFEVAGETLHGQRLAVELVTPLWQDLDGPQLESDWELVMGWQYAFRAWGR